MHVWADDHWLFTPAEFEQLPDGIELECIDNTFKVKGRDDIDMDTRYGHIAYGVRSPKTHELKELFMEMILKSA